MAKSLLRDPLTRGLNYAILNQYDLILISSLFCLSDIKLYIYVCVCGVSIHVIHIACFSLICRGYYRCSTSKGCSAKKQVERCRTDPSLLIITYTSNHSHADPADLENASNQFMETSCRSRTSTGAPSPKQAEEPETTEKKKEERNDNNEDEHFRYCLQSSPLYGSKEDNPFSEDMETTYDSQSFRVNENSKKYCPSYTPHHLTTISADLQNSEENNDFYDELEELPTSSFFSSFMRRNFFEERILVNPS